MEYVFILLVCCLIHVQQTQQSNLTWEGDVNTLFLSHCISTVASWLGPHAHYAHETSKNVTRLTFPLCAEIL